MESLKPTVVLQEQRRTRLSRRRKSKRHTTAYLRQGEWFFVPRPQFDVTNQRIEQDGALVRGKGKPHRVQALCRTHDGKTFVRGNVSHADHATIRLELWHEVFRNTETVPNDFVAEHRREQRAAEERRVMFAMRYLD
jgi:hypothetical protein